MPRLLLRLRHFCSFLSNCRMTCTEDPQTKNEMVYSILICVDRAGINDPELWNKKSIGTKKRRKVKVYTSSWHETHINTKMVNRNSL